MEKITNIITKIGMCIQTVIDQLLTLVFQPIYTICNIIQAISDIIQAEWEEDEEDEDEQPQYPEPTHVTGFRSDVDEINRIKEQLNK